jgi:hypothetical protein
MREAVRLDTPNSQMHTAQAIAAQSENIKLPQAAERASALSSDDFWDIFVTSGKERSGTGRAWAMSIDEAA